MSMQAINFAMTLPIPEPGPRLLLFIIAHHVNWQTGVMRVSQKELAKEAFASERTIRRWLEYLEAGEYITRTERRDHDGTWLTADIELSGYIEWQQAIYEGGTIRDPKTRGKPVQLPPDNLADGETSIGQNGGGPSDKNGPSIGQRVSAANEPLVTIRGNLSARAGACEAGATPSRAEAPPAAAHAAGLSSFTLTPRDAAQWGAWRAHVSEFERAAMDAAGQIEVSRRWPDAVGACILRLAKPAQISVATEQQSITARMIGDRDDETASSD